MKEDNVRVKEHNFHTYVQVMIGQRVSANLSADLTIWFNTFLSGISQIQSLVDSFECPQRIIILLIGVQILWQ